MHDRRFLVPLIAASALVQLALAIRFFGFYTGDDVEVLAEAFRVARGFSYRAWDIRNLFVPDFIVAPPVWLATRLGVSDTRTLIVIATLPFIALSSLTIAFVHALALRWSQRFIGAPGTLVAARAAALLFALHWIPLGFGSTVYPRVVAMACIAAAALLLETREEGWAAVAAGALAGVAFADRFSEIVFLAPLLLVAQRRAVHVALGAVATIGLLVGGYDWITWGEPFGSAIRFARLTLVAPDFASRVKMQSPLWYLETLPRWIALTLLPLLWYARRLRAPWLYVLVPLVALSLVRHKELRYLQGIIPFAMILAGIGYAAMPRRRIAHALLALSLVWQLYGLRFLERKTQPAVEAAQLVARDPDVHAVVMSQLWAYGDRLYFTDQREVLDVTTPPRDLATALRFAQAACLYESDVDANVRATLAQSGFREVQTFRAGKARDVVVYRRIH
ncbi:MAG TPA: hypothetical protein VFN10_23505 [Thermoanaerobaculia bacterium]|nr:hypothetical protein [Thermoanaerobaculia bacterium]